MTNEEIVNKQIKDTAKEIVNAVTSLRSSLELLMQAKPCGEFQLAIMDAESICQHMTKFLEHGPSAAYAEIPLADSEVSLNPETDLPSNPLFT